MKLGRSRRPVYRDTRTSLCVAGRYQLRGFPTVILFVNGEEVTRFSSARTAQWVQAFLEQHLAPGAGAQAAE